MCKKRLAVLLTLPLITCFLLFSVSAHPGRTDSSGGHTDQSTGEYHYHHGYSAHDHYDMDGDGIVDCPYDFNDKTNRDSSDNDTVTVPKATASPYYYLYTEPRSNDGPSVSEYQQPNNDNPFLSQRHLLIALAVSLFITYILCGYLLGDYMLEKGCIVPLAVFLITFVVVYVWSYLLH